MKALSDQIKKTIKIVLITLPAVVCVLTAVLVPLHFLTYELEGAFDRFNVDVVRVEDTAAEIGVVDKGGNYLAHPDLVFKDGKYIAMYVYGHGKGRIITKTSSDGINWGGGGLKTHRQVG